MWFGLRLQSLRNYVVGLADKGQLAMQPVRCATTLVLIERGYVQSCGLPSNFGVS